MSQDPPLLAKAFPESLRLGDSLRRDGISVAVAESCTGGLLGAVLTASPGSSAYVLGGVIAYDNDVKVRLLDVPAELIRAHGAVSAEVAEAMAQGVRTRLGARLGIAITGVAGPGAEESKPAGLVWVAVAGPEPSGIRLTRLDGDRGREANRAAAVTAALRLCLEVV